VRGLDVFSLLPSEYLSENEVAAAALADQDSVFNPQTQFSVSWPAEPVVARAYIDQLERTSVLSESAVADLNAALDRSDSQLASGRSDRGLADSLESLSMSLNQIGGDTITMKRRSALAETLDGISARLR
jgi:hypothetical protein